MNAARGTATVNGCEVAPISQPPARQQRRRPAEERVRYRRFPQTKRLLPAVRPNPLTRQGSWKHRASRASPYHQGPRNRQNRRGPRNRPALQNQGQHPRRRISRSQRACAGQAPHPLAQQRHRQRGQKAPRKQQNHRNPKPQQPCLAQIRHLKSQQARCPPTHHPTPRQSRCSPPGPPQEELQRPWRGRTGSCPSPAPPSARRPSRRSSSRRNHTTPPR